MEVKRFKAATMKEALDMVKRELGDEAVILKSEKVAHKGLFDLVKKDMIEIVAAVDVPDVGPLTGTRPAPNREPVSSPGGNLAYFTQRNTQAEAKAAVGGSEEIVDFSDYFQQQLDQKSGQKNRMDNRSSSGDPMHEPARDRSRAQSRSAKKPDMNVRSRENAKRRASSNSTVSSLRAEISELRGMINSMSNTMALNNPMTVKDFADMPAPYAQEMMVLMQNGVERDLAKMLVGRAASGLPVAQVHNPEILQARIYEEVAGMIKTSGPIKCKKGKTKVIALVGPTGVGKTTTLAKLAANSKFLFEKNVSLISADTYRMSAIEHLNNFASVAHVPLSAVYSPDELKSSLNAQSGKDLIFIDTAGRSPRDEKHLSELKDFMETAKPDEIHLVLPANIRNRDLLESLRRFDPLGINRIVISKVDETSALGGILNIAVEVDKPISYITNGQTIPDDIDLANPKSLANLIMRAA